MVYPNTTSTRVTSRSHVDVALQTTNETAWRVVLEYRTEREETGAYNADTWFNGSPDEDVKCIILQRISVIVRVDLA